MTQSHRTGHDPKPGYSQGTWIPSSIAPMLHDSEYLLAQSQSITQDQSPKQPRSLALLQSPAQPYSPAPPQASAYIDQCIPPIDHYPDPHQSWFCPKVDALKIPTSTPLPRTITATLNKSALDASYYGLRFVANPIPAYGHASLPQSTPPRHSKDGFLKVTVLVVPVCYPATELALTARVQQFRDCCSFKNGFQILMKRQLQKFGRQVFEGIGEIRFQPCLCALGRRISVA
ncbi:hypothetical protein BDK51DRAFT_46515 [Blyttiomyces helicus]|uniref:Uncharacterized protein n=1 Tax=Blyttiomyces helicus TaxID=388810 RepID=A0A4P9WR78_9FUNG|nr:hypothetical protein BDK51DRAFT_46515 [Blyttiomyces helicus]|eukprot:RKO94358.1 hypothetical protein BDK51DRAFT_46515 [Blyttiomyces helicus]